MKSKISKYLIISVVLHALLFVGFGLSSGEGEGEGEGEGDSTHQAPESSDTKIIDKPQEKQEIELIEITPEQQEILDQARKKQKEQEKQKESECKESFGGIGVMIAFGYEYTTITEAVKNYPAYNAGLQAGDIILEPSLLQIKGEIGTSVQLTIKRGSNTFKIDLIRDKICIDKVTK